jgi:hypothetical protein
MAVKVGIGMFLLAEGEVAVNAATLGGAASTTTETGEPYRGDILS